MKVAKLLLAAAIAAPTLFLTSCEKQIDVQAETMNREATRSLARPAEVVMNYAEATDESGWNLSAFNTGIACGTATWQEFVNGKWTDLPGTEQSFNMLISYNRPVRPAVGSQFRVFFVPSKGQNGCPVNLQRGGSNVFTVQ